MNCPLWGNSSYGCRDKGSDGWYTDWTKTVNINDVYNVYTNARNGYTNEIVSTTLTGTRPHTSQTITTGVNFDPFTAGEWYEEHKDDLARYGTPPPTYTPGTAYSKETGSTTIKTGSTFIAIASSSPTDAALKVKGISAPSKSKVQTTGVPVKGVVSTKTAKQLGQAAKQNKPAPKKQTPAPKKQMPAPKKVSNPLINTAKTIAKGAWDYLLNPALKFVATPLNAIYTGAKYAGKAKNILMAIPKGLEGTLYGLIGGLANVPPPNLQIKYPKEWITSSLSEALSANDKKADSFFNKHPVLKAGIDLVSDAGMGLLIGGAVKSLTNIFKNPVPKVTYSSNTAQGLLKKNRIPSTLTDEEIAAANKVDLQMSLKKIDDKYLKKQGIDAHELKSDFVGNKNISKYDLYVETDTREIFIYQKGAKGQGIATGEYIKK